MRRQTLIDGEAYWFMICCVNECSSIAYGPYYSEEMAQADANLDTCEWGHFITQYVPEFVLVEQPVYEFLTDVPSELVDVFASWLREHNNKIYDHPTYQMSGYNVDNRVQGKDLEKVFLNALHGSSD